MEILAEGLCLRHLVQRSFLDESNPRADQVADLKQTINQKIGRFAIRSGDTLPLATIYSDETNDYDICDVRGKICF